MEQFSNEINAIWQRARQELLEKEGSCWVFYQERPHFEDEFSISVEKNKIDEFIITTKWWDKHHDFKKYQQIGLLNLDRLRILEKTKSLSENQKQLLLEMVEQLKSKELPEKMEDEGIIVLDGCEHRLLFSNLLIQKEYKWRVANKNYAVIEDVISFLLENSSLAEFEKPE